MRKFLLVSILILLSFLLMNSASAKSRCSYEKDQGYFIDVYLDKDTISQKNWQSYVIPCQNECFEYGDEAWCECDPENFKNYCMTSDVMASCEKVAEWRENSRYGVDKEFCRYGCNKKTGRCDTKFEGFGDMVLNMGKGFTDSLLDVAGGLSEIGKNQFSDTVSASDFREKLEKENSDKEKKKDEKQEKEPIEEFGPIKGEKEVTVKMDSSEFGDIIEEGIELEEEVEGKVGEFSYIKFKYNDVSKRYTIRFYNEKGEFLEEIVLKKKNFLILRSKSLETGKKSTLPEPPEHTREEINRMFEKVLKDIIGNYTSEELKTTRKRFDIEIPMPKVNLDLLEGDKPGEYEKVSLRIDNMPVPENGIYLDLIMEYKNVKINLEKLFNKDLSKSSRVTFMRGEIKKKAVVTENILDKSFGSGKEWKMGENRKVRIKKIWIKENGQLRIKAKSNVINFQIHGEITLDPEDNKIGVNVVKAKAPFPLAGKIKNAAKNAKILQETVSFKDIFNDFPLHSGGNFEDLEVTSSEVIVGSGAVS